LLFQGASYLGSKILSNTPKVGVSPNSIELSQPKIDIQPQVQAKPEIQVKPKVEPFIIQEPTTNTLQLKSTMMGSPLEKQLSKDGSLNMKSLQVYLNNQSTSETDRAMIQKVLDEKFPGYEKVNYNEFRKAISDELVPLKKNFDSNHSNYGVGALGYPAAKKSSFEKAIQNGENLIKELELKYITNKDKSILESIENAKFVLEKNKRELLKIPQENTSIVYSNKYKFGRGSTDHFENEGTLGHSRILVSNEEPNVMHVLEQQSDFYQKHSPEEIGMSVELEKNIKRLDDLHQLRQTELKEMLENKTVFKIVWIFIFAIILGFVRVVYNEIKTPYAIFRSLFLSVCAALIV
jgi:hypothetical protein